MTHSQPQCTVCQGLKVQHHSIPPDSLFTSSTAGCEACSILYSGIRNFRSTFDGIVALELLVDLSLHVYIIGEKERVESVIEFYTEPGNTQSHFPYLIPSLLILTVERANLWRGLESVPVGMYPTTPRAPTVSCWPGTG